MVKKKKLDGNAAILAVLPTTWTELRRLPLRDWQELEALALAALAAATPAQKAA